jgi:ABC-2 type transport system permease protein
MKQTLAITRKELTSYFGSPMALIFLGTFLAVTLFAFFWVETFFERNIADLRPMFQWMPVLTIFLVAALTMRQWSEEQRSGTIEVLLTVPVHRFQLVLGKFLAVMAMITLALVLTLFLPITVEILGDLDWGPVVGGYVATLLMASAYAAIGLFVSSRTDNQIVSLIVTMLLGGVFYLVGSSGVTGLVGNTLGDILRAIGTGSRFESIERGVIDLRDLIYYLSLTASFLIFNVVSLDAKRWSQGPQTAAYRRTVVVTVVLITANLVALNTWLFPLSGLRADLTADKTYSLSQTSRDLISNLNEPLLIRGYFSETTHPLLAPLVPTIRDMLSEYKLASKGKIEVEIVDPRDNEELEEEANQVYGISATPFQVSGRYESSIINSYFDLLIRYGDQYETLNYSDLIEVESTASGDMVVRLRNLEYDLTSSIKKVVYGFQSLDSAFASIQDPITLTAFITPQTLPSGLQAVSDQVEKVGSDLQQESGGKLTFQVIDPDDPNASVNRESLMSSYGLRPFAVSLFSPDSYYLHLLLEIGSEVHVLYPTGDMTEADIRTEIESTLKRAAPGFLKTVGLWLPTQEATYDMYGYYQEPISSWEAVQQQLAQNYTVKTVDLTSGRVEGDVDVLLIVAPQQMSEKEQFAVDQYLMRGGAVIVVSGNYVLSPEQYYSITMDVVEGGLHDVLASYGVEIGDSMVLDTRCEGFPMQVQRQVGDMQVAEYQLIAYPYFVDVRSDSMNDDNPIVSNLPAVTLQWASPLTLDEAKMGSRQVDILLESTEDSWLRSSSDVQPDLNTYPELGFAVEGEQKAWPLAVAIRGSFESYFKGKESPFEVQSVATPTATVTETATETDTETGTETIETPEPVLGTVEVSPESSRLVVVSSSEFINDTVLQILRSVSGERYLYNLQLMQNAVDWAVEDEDLLSIRSRGTYSHLLKTLDNTEQSLWEGLNYGLTLAALVALGVVSTVRRKQEQPMTLVEKDDEAGGNNA